MADYSTAVTTVTVGLPTGVQSGDTLIAQIIVYDGSASDVPTPPSGWTGIRHDAVSNGNQATSWLYYKVAGANEPAWYGWNISSNWAAGVMGAWRGASVSPVDNTSGSTAAGASPVFDSAPSLISSNNNELQIYFYGSQAHADPTITLSSALTQRFDIGSLKEGFTLAFADLAAPAASNASPTYSATASISGSGAAMTAQAILLIPASQSATPTPTGTTAATATRTATPTAIGTTTSTAVPTDRGCRPLTATATAMPTATATPSSSITFVGAGPLADYSTAVTTVTVGLPTGVQSGDTLIAQIIVYDGSASDVPTPPSGWTGIRHDAVSNGNQATSWLYYKVAGANESASYGWNISSNWAAGVMGAWRGASVSPVDNTSGSTAAGASPVFDSAPSLISSNNNELQIYFYGSQAHADPTITLSSALTQRFDIGSLKEGFTLAFADLAAPAASNASPTYSATASISGSGAVMTAQAILLIPASTTSSTGKPQTSQRPSRHPVNGSHRRKGGVSVLRQEGARGRSKD